MPFDNFIIGSKKGLRARLNLDILTLFLATHEEFPSLIRFSVDSPSSTYPFNGWETFSVLHVINRTLAKIFEKGYFLRTKFFFIHFHFLSMYAFTYFGNCGNCGKE